MAQGNTVSHWQRMTEPAARILRVHPEPSVMVDDVSVHAALTASPAGYLRFLEEHLRDVATGHVRVDTPAQAICPDGPGLGGFRVMPCVTHHSGGVTKTVAIAGTNVTGSVVPDQIGVGRTVCLHPEDNCVTHIYDTCLLSAARAGACAALALAQLAFGNASISIVGAGRVGLYTALYAATRFGVKKIVFHDARKDRAETIALWGNESLGIPCEAAGVHRVEACDALILATTSTTPIFAPGDVATPLVISTGADTEDHRELHASWAASADVYVDSMDAVRVGDLRAWIRDGHITPADLRDLTSLLREGPRHGHSRPRVFISAGSALLDNLSIAYMQNGA